MPTPFAVTYDYRCPFARNAHEHLLAGLADGADWDVRFSPLSLSQLHVEEGGADVWDTPASDSGLWALQASVLVRQRHPEQFLAVHRALFGIRHDRGEHLDAPTVTATLASLVGVGEAAAIAQSVDAGETLPTVRKEHEAAVDGPGAWGVPTFVLDDDRAAFVRLMDRNPGETAEQRAHGRVTIERILDLLTWTDLNEFKAVTIPQ